MQEQQVGGYRILQEIGRGGLGVVYRAQDARGAPVALKLLLVGGSASAAQRRRFEQEVRSLLRLRHPLVMQVVDAGEQRGVPWLATEWIDGESLELHLARRGPFPPREAAQLVARLARAVQACHEQGVLHRDLKPQNVVLRAGSGEPVLIDFGLAGELSRDTGRSALTVTGQLVGSPAWWPPEQAAGDRQAIGPRSDVYGLGALLYGLLSAAPLHTGESLQEVLLALERGPRPLRELVSDLPPGLEAICAQALQPDPARRYPSALALAESLERWLVDDQAAGSGSARGPGLSLPVGLGLVAAGLVCTLLAGEVWLRPAATPPEASPPEPVLLDPTPPPAPEPAPPLDPARVGIDDPRVVEAAAMLDRGDLPGARGALDALLEAEPEHPGALRLRAWVRSLQHDQPGAIEDSRRLLRQVPGDVDVRGNLASLLGDAGRLAEALTEVERALRDAPEHRNNQVLHARLRLAHSPDQLPAALEELGRVLAADPVHVGALRARAQAYLDCGRFQEALLDAERRRALRGEDPEGLRQTARARLGLGDGAGAVADLERLVAARPEQPGDWTDLGFARRLNQDLSGAEAAYDQALALDPGFLKALSNRGTARRLQGNLSGALADLDRAIALSQGGDQAMLFQRGLVHQARGDLPAARADFAACLDLNEWHLDARYSLAELALEGGDRVSARSQLQWIVDHAPASEAATRAADLLRQLDAR